MRRTEENELAPCDLKSEHEVVIDDLGEGDGRERAFQEVPQKPNTPVAVLVKVSLHQIEYL